MFIELIEEKLDQARVSLAASSCTFYMPDPHSPDQFRLVAMSGVKFKEPMYGFIFPDSAKKIVSEGDLKIFCQKVVNCSTFISNPIALGKIHKDRKRLFGDFITREKVISSARIIHKEKKAVLFVNFSQETEFTESLKNDILSLFESIVDELSTIQNELIFLDAPWLSVARIVSPALSIANPSFQSVDELDKYFSQIIELLLEIMDIEKGTGLGTLHLYDAEKQTLELHGEFGKIDREKAMQHSVSRGEGIVSWVILRERALLIRDLNQSEFSRIHRWINKDVKSELAVPLDVDGETIGVICLECTESNKFLPHHVRSLWYAANKAAVAYQLNRQASMNRKLIDLCWKATGKKMEVQTSLKDITEIAVEYFEASYCDIWQWNAYAGIFDVSAANYADFKPQPRKNGWTAFVQRTQKTIWIGSITSTTRFTIHYWTGEDWFPGPGGDRPPDELNTPPVEQGVRGEMGIPITVRGECIGVVWVKYIHPRKNLPLLHLVNLANGIASEAGLVLELIHGRTIKGDIDFVAQQIADKMFDRWELAKSDIIDACIVSKPHMSNLGGDFYAGKRINEFTVGLILIDGEGHGIRGCLHMLPLMAAFESSYNSCSTAHVATELFQLARTIGVTGTMVYCIITVIDDKKWICASRAGHENLIIFALDEAKWTFNYFPKEKGPLLGHPMKIPIMEERQEIKSGNIVVGFTDGLAEHSEINDLTNFVSGFLNSESQDPKLLTEAILKWKQIGSPMGFKDDVTVFAIRIK